MTVVGSILSPRTAAREKVIWTTDAMTLMPVEITLMGMLRMLNPLRGLPAAGVAGARGAAGLAGIAVVADVVLVLPASGGWLSAAHESMQDS